jgi:hypothetical protein
MAPIVTYSKDGGVIIESEGVNPNSVTVTIEGSVDINRTGLGQTTVIFQDQTAAAQLEPVLDGRSILLTSDAAGDVRVDGQQVQQHILHDWALKPEQQG